MAAGRDVPAARATKLALTPTARSTRATKIAAAQIGKAAEKKAAALAAPTSADRVSAAQGLAGDLAGRPSADQASAAPGLAPEGSAAGDARRSGLPPTKKKTENIASRKPAAKNDAVPATPRAITGRMAASRRLMAAPRGEAGRTCGSKFALAGTIGAAATRVIAVRSTPMRCVAAARTVLAVRTTLSPVIAVARRTASAIIQGDTAGAADISEAAMDRVARTTSLSMDIAVPCITEATVRRAPSAIIPAGAHGADRMDMAAIGDIISPAITSAAITQVRIMRFIAIRAETFGVAGGKPTGDIITPVRRGITNRGMTSGTNSNRSSAMGQNPADRGCRWFRIANSARRPTIAAVRAMIGRAMIGRAMTGPAIADLPIVADGARRSKSGSIVSRPNWRSFAAKCGGGNRHA